MQEFRSSSSSLPEFVRSTAPRLVLGVDLGQREDYTAIAAVQSSTLQERYEIVGLTRLPIGTAYPEVVEKLRELKSRSELRHAELAVDATGVGRPVLDYLDRAGLRPIAITIHGGEQTTALKDRYLEYRVPKRDIIATLQVAVQNGWLKLNPVLKHAPTLTKELQAMKVRIDRRTAHDSYGAWREGEHDDLVLAVGIAVWCLKIVPRSGIRLDALASEYWKVRYFVDGI